MNPINEYLKPVLDAISEGSVFRKVLGNTLRVVAVLFFLGSLLAWLVAFGNLSEISFLGGIGFLIYQLFLLVAIVLVASTIWLRGSTVLDLEPGSFTLIPIGAIILRLIGETTFIHYVAMSIPSMLAMWLGAGGLISVWGMPGDLLSLGTGAAAAGILLFIGSLVTAFVALLITYLMGEILEVIYRIAIDLRRARIALENGAPGNGSKAPSSEGKPVPGQGSPELESS